MILSYVKEKHKRIWLDLVFILIFTLCFYLTDVKLQYVGYPTLLCMIIFCIYVGSDLYQFARHHKLLQKIDHHVEETLERLPNANGQLEEDYQQLLETMRCHNQREQHRLKQQLEGNKEYITLWAHQIKTPITAMGLLLQELDESNYVDKTRELSTKLFEIEQYVDSSLQYMRLDSMTSDLVLKEIPVFDMVKQSVRYYAKIFISKRLSIHLLEEDTMVVTDEKWLVFVLKQLLSNALKYTRTGSISIYMEPGEEKILVIEDTGIGIAAEDLPRICERGFTGYNGRMDKKATGIGLYLSHSILDKLGHGLTITSEEGVGTKVMIRF